MLRSLTSLFRNRFEAAQLTLELDAPPPPRDATELLHRLRTLGLKRIESCELTRNRNVMVSFRAHELRIHEGFLAAPEDVHRAIVTFIQGRTRAERAIARRRIVSYKIETPARGAARRERTRAEDEPLAAKLAEWHARYNEEYFGGTLKTIPLRVSRRMKSRLGHYTPATKDGPAEIAISWRHLRRHGWTETLHTLLHEMVHQWQDETGIPIDHGPRFRAKARELGIEAAAKRAVARG